MRRRGPLPSLLLLLVAGSCAWWSRSVPAAEPAADVETFLRLRTGLHDVLTWTETAGGVFAPDAPETAPLPLRADRQAAWDAWHRFLDYQVALEALALRHEDWWRRTDSGRTISFAIARARSGRPLSRSIS